MAKTDAERSAAYRQRRSRREAELQASVVDLGQRLENALAEIERLSSAQCRHPAEAVEGGVCRSCGADIW